MGNETQAGRISRRSFIKTSAAVSAAAMAAPSGNIFAAGSGKVRIGLVGCGGRGTGAAENCLDADPAVELVAMADVFDDMLQGSLKRLKKKYGDRVKVTPETSFLGFARSIEIIQRTFEFNNIWIPMFETKEIKWSAPIIRTFNNSCEIFIVF